MPSQPERGQGQSDVLRGLHRLGSTLAAINAMVSSIGLAASAAAQVSAETRQETELAHQSIERAIQLVQDGGHHHGPHFRVVDVAPDIANYQIDHAVVPPHHPLDVMIHVRASAQLGGLLLSFSEFCLSETITLRITGNRGPAEITIISGATIDNLEAALANVFPLTGVQAYSTGTAIHLLSEAFGSGGFVSVQLLGVSRLPPTGSGIYRLDAHDFFHADPTLRIPWGSVESLAGVRDFGQDLEADINGRQAHGCGLSLRVWTPHLRLQTTLQVVPGVGLGHAFNLGTFRAFRILRD